MDTKELYETADLAQLALGEDEAAGLSEAVSGMIAYFSRMGEIDVDGLEPTTHALLRKNRTRRDGALESDADALLEIAPELEDRFIVIPNVL